MSRRICGPGLCHCDDADLCAICGVQRAEADYEGLCEPCYLCAEAAKGGVDDPDGEAEDAEDGA